MHNSNKLEIKISDKLIKSKIIPPESVQVSPVLTHHISPSRYPKIGFLLSGIYRVKSGKNDEMVYKNRLKEGIHKSIKRWCIHKLRESNQEDIFRNRVF